MSPGRCAVPDGMFSTRPTMPTALTLALRPASACIRPITTPAPAMSHFMSSMPPAGLIEMPPVSKVTPLPTKATGAWFLALGAPFHCMTTRRGGRTLPWPTPSSAPMPSFFICFSPSTSTSTPSFSSRARGLGQRLGIDDVGRLGDEVAGEEHASATFSSGCEGALRRRPGPRPGWSAPRASASAPASPWCGTCRSGRSAAARHRRCRRRSSPRPRPCGRARPRRLLARAIELRHDAAAAILPVRRARRRPPCRCRRAARAPRSRCAGASTASVSSPLPLKRLAAIARRQRAAALLVELAPPMGSSLRSSATGTATVPECGRRGPAKVIFMADPSSADECGR